MEPVCVLWTGGWDSTFRVLDLLITKQRNVSPVYVVDKGRGSLHRELATMDQIRVELEVLNSAAAKRLGEVRLVEKVTADDVYLQVWKRIRAIHRLGTQYHWLPRSLAVAGVPLSDLCIHQDDKAAKVIGQRVTQDGDQIYVDAKSGSDLFVLFSRFRLPLYNLTKLEMQDAASAGGFSELMELTWFCFRPTSDGRPCGNCNPCKYTRQEGLGRRIS